MSKGKTWQDKARRVVRAYPRLHAELLDLQRMSVTPRLSGMPGGGDAGRATEDAALRQLPPDEQTAHDAVEHALRMLGLFRTAAKRRRLVELVYWRQTHTVYGAGVELGVSEETAKRWNGDFLLTVAGYLQARWRS